MNCLEFRRRLGSEPECSLALFIAHRDECPSCAAALARAEEFDALNLRWNPVQVARPWLQMNVLGTDR